MIKSNDNNETIAEAKVINQSVSQSRLELQKKRQIDGSSSNTTLLKNDCIRRGPCWHCSHSRFVNRIYLKPNSQYSRREVKFLQIHFTLTAYLSSVDFCLKSVELPDFAITRFILVCVIN